MHLARLAPLALLSLLVACSGDDGSTEEQAAASSGGKSQSGGASAQAGASQGGKAGAAQGQGGGQQGAGSAGAPSQGGSSGMPTAGAAGQGGTSAGGQAAAGQGQGGDSAGGQAAAGQGGTSAGGQGQGGAGVGGQGGQAQGGQAGGDAPTEKVSYQTTGELFANPERGFYRAVELLDEQSLDWTTEGGVSLVYSYIRLDDYRDSSIPQALLDQASAKLDMARQAGVKVILRFSYNFGPYPDSEPDAPKARILEHIGQVTPLLRDNEDVLALVQAGFIGAWGEWHTSTNDLLADPQDRRDIIEALITALPASRSTQIRYPPYKQEMYGAPLTEQTAFDGSFAARMGHHNDCFLASDTDEGTYPDDAVEATKQYVAADTAFVPMGGETCADNPPRSSCPTALAEMQLLHTSFINLDYHPDVVTGWQDGGCFDEMRRRLGYRLELVSAEIPPAARPGGRFVLRIAMHNAGFAAPFNPRPAVLVLRGQGARHEVTLPVDVRRFLPGDVAIEAHVELPATLAKGSYELALRLPDASASLASNPAYAIRLDAEGAFDPATGDNVLGAVEVSDEGPGEANAAAPGLGLL